MVKKGINVKKNNNTGRYYEPYCFVSFNENVMKSQFSFDNIPHPMDIKKELLSGVIYYSVDALSPIILHDDESDIIPASSVRGLIRENLQILSFSSLRNDIENRHLFYRGIDLKSSMYAEYQKRIGTEIDKKGPNNRKQYPKIKAGIIECNSDGYYIKYIHNTDQKTDFEPTYYSIDLMRLQQNDDGWRRSYNVEGIDRKNVFDCLKSINFTARKRVQRKDIKPFFKKVVYNIDSLGQINSILDTYRATAGSREGYLLSSGMFLDQHTFYLIPTPTTIIKRIKISEEDINIFIRESNNKKKSDSEFYNLPRKNSEKPVFFIDEGNHIRFGFTLLFPLADQKGLQDRIKTENCSDLDNAMALFGYKKNGIVYPGRLSFSDLTLFDSEENKPEIKKIGEYLGRPKPQGFNNYFDSELYCKGIKMYWLRENQLSTESTHESLVTMKNQKEVRYFPVGSKLNGSVRFFNITKEELGLLLWSIELNEDSEQLIGGYKAYGYGRIKITISSCQLLQNSTYYLIPTNFLTSRTNVGTNSRNRYIKLYQEQLDTFLNGKLSENIRLKEFFYTKKIHSEVVKKIIPYSEWRMTKQMQMEGFTTYAEKNIWIALNEEQKNEVLKHILWDEFVLNPPEDLVALKIYQDIIERYQELVSLFETFNQNDNYYVRKEILETVSRLSDFSIATFKKIVHEYESENILSFYVEAVEYFDKCLNEIANISLKFDQIKSVFLNETVPKINVEGIKNEDRLSIVIHNRQVCSTAFVNTIELTCDNRIFKYKRFVRLQGDATSTIEISLGNEQKELIETCNSSNVKILYKYLDEVGFQSAQAMGIVINSCIDNDKKVLQNPYAAYVKGGPVTGNKMFFGRKELIREVLSYIEARNREDISGQICILYGQQRSGKSSILEHIRQELTNKDDTYIVATIGNIGSIEPSENDLLGEIALCIVRGINIDDVNIELLKKKCFEVFSSDTPRREFGVFMKMLADFIQRRRKIVLLIDEFTYLSAWIENDYIRKDFIRFWKAFIQNYDISSVIVGQDFMPDFISDYKNEFGTSKTIRVSYLEKEDAIDLIRVPFTEYNLFNPYSNDALNKIIELSAGSAFYIMIICNAIVAYLEKNNLKTIDAAAVMNVVKDYLFSEERNNRIDMDIFDPLIYDGYYYEYVNDNVLILRIVSSLEENGSCSFDKLISMCEKIGISNARHKIERLEKREVISLKEGREVSIRVKLFKEFLLNKYGDIKV